MTFERPTVRPVSLSRLVETAHACQAGSQNTALIEEALDITHRRARETILEALRMELIEAVENGEEEVYETTATGDRLVEAVENERWTAVSDILESQSPHYAAFLLALQAGQPASLETALQQVQKLEFDMDRTYNQASVEVLGNWAERLGIAQRNAFTGEYYLVENPAVPQAFPNALLSVYDDLEQTAGIALRQRYLSIPALREQFCSVHRCPRDVFDEAIQELASANIGKVELSGAPLDTSAKDSALGIKSIERTNEGGFVSTSQSTERVMAGVEQHGKRYYYFAVFDRDLKFPEEVPS